MWPVLWWDPRDGIHPYFLKVYLINQRAIIKCPIIRAEYLDDLIKVDYFYMEQFAYLCNKMNRIEEANGKSLLDNIMFTYGSGLGDGSTHQYSALPVIIAGSGGGKFITWEASECLPNQDLLKK